MFEVIISKLEECSSEEVIEILDDVECEEVLLRVEDYYREKVKALSLLN